MAFVLWFTGIPASGKSTVAQEVERILLASLLEKHGVSAIVAAVSSLRQFRDRARGMSRNFVEVYVQCPVEVCMERDPKRLYARAERGEVNDIAGLHQPYEPSLNPEVICSSDRETVLESARKVIVKLEELGLLPPENYTFGDEEKIKERLRSLGYL
jgi:adenylylsulfate kinase